MLGEIQDNNCVRRCSRNDYDGHGISGRFFLVERKQDLRFPIVDSNRQVFTGLLQPQMTEVIELADHGFPHAVTARVEIQPRIQCHGAK